jgi:hypothetical protein
MVMLGHDGFCCGIQVVYNLGQEPSAKLPAADFPKQYPTGQYHGRSLAYFKAVPVETALERLERYIRHFESPRPEVPSTFHRKGILEVVVNDLQNPFWESVLLERGFKLVNSCLNSNSGRVIFVYHRNSGEVPKLDEQLATLSEADQLAVAAISNQEA